MKGECGGMKVECGGEKRDRADMWVPHARSTSLLNQPTLDTFDEQYRDFDLTCNN